MPQWETPRTTTRSGHRSQTAALAAQFASVRSTPTRRTRAAVALAIARLIDRNGPVWQVKQAM